MAAEDSRTEDPRRAVMDGVYRVARSRAGQHDLRRLEDPPIRRRWFGGNEPDMEIKLVIIGGRGKCIHCGVCRRVGVRMRCGRRA